MTYDCYSTKASRISLETHVEELRRRCEAASRFQGGYTYYGEEVSLFQAYAEEGDFYFERDPEEIARVPDDEGNEQLRNPVLARVFRELDLIEQWGSGIPGIFRQAAAENLPEPVIEELAGRLRFTIPLKQIVPLSREQSRATLAQDQSKKASGVDSGTQSGTQSGAQSGAQSGVESGVESAMSLSILELLKDSPLAKSEIAGKLGKAKPTRYLNDLVAKLLRSDLIEYTLPDKPQSRLQKYRLTEKGRTLCEKDEG